MLSHGLTTGALDAPPSAPSLPPRQLTSKAAAEPLKPRPFNIDTQVDGSLRINGTHEVRSSSPDNWYVVRLGAGGRDEILSWHQSEEEALAWIRAELAGKHAALPPHAEQEI
jgi:hypothetical protein